MMNQSRAAKRSTKRASALITVSFALFASCILWRAAPPPSLEIQIDPPVVLQGKTLVLWVRCAEPLTEVEGCWGDRQIQLYVATTGEETLYRSIIGIPVDTPPGQHELEVRATSRRRRKMRQQRSLTVSETEFLGELISIPSEKSGLLTSPYLSKEAKAIRAAVRDGQTSQIWRGGFLLPADGRISSPFGARRVYNDGTASWQHKGVDIANAEGTQILAPNSGVVVFSQPMKVHGGTIILDHGQGVFSIFYHLKERLAEPGDEIERGETIGLMGETGLATGPHLHWGLYVGGVAVDPIEWTQRSMGRIR